MNLRPAEKKDSKTLFNWRNDESTYRHYLNPNPVSWSEHTKWFEKSLFSQDRQIYLAEVNKEVVGMARVDKKENNYELSWVIDPKFRGKGYGKQMLNQIIGISHGCLLARIKTDNVPSLAMARSLGFRCVSPEGTLFSEWVLEK